MKKSQNQSMDTASNCEAYMSRLFRKEKSSFSTSGFKSNANNGKPKLSVNKYSSKTKTLGRLQNTNHHLVKACTTCIEDMNVHKDVYAENPGVEIPAKSKPRSRSNAAGDREPWGRLLQTSNNENSSKFSGFDPLRTLHFLAKELQFKLQNDLPDDSNLQQIIMDMQHALTRVPPEIASAIKLQHSSDAIPIKKSSSSNSVLQNKRVEEDVRKPKVNRSCQTVQKFEDAELIQKIMEGSTMKLEASCRQMEMLCGRLKSEKEDLEEQLKTERENVKFLKKRVGDLEVQTDQLVSVTIRRLEEEKNELQLQVNKLTDVVDSQSVHTSYELKSVTQELKQVQMKAEQECGKLKHQLALANMEKEKYIAILTVRDKQISEIRAEMSQLQDVVNEQLLDIHNNALTELPSTNSLETENGWMMKEHLNDESENPSNLSLAASENPLNFVPKDSRSYQELPSGELTNLSEGIFKGSDINSKNTPKNKQSIRNMFEELKKQAFAVTSLTTMRPIVNEAVNNAEKLYEDLKKFIIPPVMQRIELNEPLEFLTELRQVTVLMINIVPHSITFDSLISLVKRIYRIMTIHIQKFSGCINKVSCFDKDLMCVIIFGLRGLKQDLECRNALRCAGLIYEDINVLSKVKSISIGVSTGKTYCGVFGHTLRREYTVIGLTVNKAARLMVAYSDKVTCCNETFINCKMRESYFEQQSYVHLKGIKNPGPVYEFKYAIFDASKMLTVHVHPILGRDEELLLYKKLLDIFLEYKSVARKKNPIIKMIMIEGEAKSGKTRLVEEFMYITPPDISFQVILAENTAHKPHTVLKHMFFFTMGIAFKAPRHIKLETFQFYLGNFPHKNILCALNEVFDINFPITEEYLNKTEEDKVMYVGIVLQYLAVVVFQSPTIFVIERMMLMDDLTWQVLPILLNARNIFVIACIRPHKKSRSETRRWIFSSRKVKYLKLKPIDKMYHAALACQMIGVEAIPPDLENAIQSKSNGNAGWIKNFLICLQQAKGIITKPMTYNEIYDNGLVAPPLYMMMRLTRNQLSIWKRIMEEHSEEDTFYDPWFKYVDTCRDQFTDIGIRKEIKKLFECQEEVKACITTPEFKNFDEHNEQSEEIYVIRTFDSLLYSEQLVAKCGSVLGWQFPRAMLEYVVGDKFSKREKAEAVQRLFENRIFGCSKGDFTEAGNYVIIRSRDQLDFETQSIKCNCQGLHITECCSDLPKYASCGYLHFISSGFLEATYNLLPEAQKNEFHLQAAKYFEKNTRKCRACGNGFFEEFTGRIERPMRIRKTKNIPSRMSSNDEDFISRSSYRSDNEESILGSHAHSSENVSSDYSPEIAYFEALGVINPKRLYQMKEKTSLTRTFSLYDFSSCQCKLILNYVHGEIYKHYKYAGLYSQMLEAMFEYAKSCLDLENTPETFTTLEIAHEHLKTKGISSEEPYWKRSLLEGKIHSLRGRALLQTNQTELAEYNLLKAMEHYGAPFPKSNIASYIKSHSLKLKQKFALYLYPDTMIKQLKHYEAEYFNDLSECLHWLTQLYLEKGEQKQVELSAIWGLQCALKANLEFSMVCQSFTNMLVVAQRNCNNFHCLALEIHSLRYCHKKIFDIDSDDLKYVAELYHVIGGSRRSRSELDKSIYIGYITLRLAISVNHSKLILKVIPRQVLLLMLKSYLPEACSMLNELDYYSSEADCNSIQSGRLSFHVMCLRFQIETGYTFIPYKESEKFNYAVNLQLAALNDPIARIEFVSLMWLWNCRNRRWEYTAKWKNYIDSYVEEILKNPTGIPYAIMYVLEGFLLCLVHSKNSQNISSHKILNKVICKLFKHLEKSSRFTKFILPRLKHFQAYYEYIKGNEEKALDMLENSLIYAAKSENTLELVHINHSKLAWSNQLQRSSRDKWVSHCDEDNLLDYRILQGYDDKIISFTLPKPIYA